MSAQPINRPDYKQRQERLATILSRNNLDFLALSPGPSLVYLTGLHFHMMERPVVALFSTSQPPAIVLPELEAGKAAQASYPIQVFAYTEEPAGWIDIFKRAAQATNMNGKRVGVEPTRLRFLELRFLEAAAEAAQFLSAEEIIAEMRMRKDPNEITAMRKAVDIAQRGLQATLPAIKSGVTEREIASELTLQLLRAGAEPEFPFPPIVSGGPNAANPHATPTLRPLQTGDLLVIDWGAASDGYFSDLTRTFAIGEVSQEMQQLVSIVEAANAAGRQAAGPGVAAGEVDRAARKVIEDAGYGEYFIHRTGHGLGMEGHEAPYIRMDNPLILESGMTFTIEPGIYLPNRNGARIEDDMVITETGSESLSNLPRNLITLG